MADRIETNFSYMEGTWAAESMIKQIDKTEYKTVEQAIKVKQELINHFEKDFGFDRNMDEMDSNYAYNYGMLDKLKEEHGES